MTRNNSMIVLVTASLLTATGAALAGGGTCTPGEQYKLLGDAEAGEEFGIGVDLSGDVLVVGAQRDVISGMSQHGSMFVYRHNGLNWTFEAKLVASDGAAFDRFARKVGVDGDTAIAGAHFDDDAGSKSGSATIFQYNGASWGQVVKLTALDASGGDEFGWSVAISGDIAVVGAHFDDASAGSAYVFERHAGGVDEWGQVARLTASDAVTGDQFGESVAIDGDRIIVGASMAGGVGAAYIFDMPVGGWVNMTETAKLTASDANAGDEFGKEVAIDGDVVLTGSYRDDDMGSDSGATYIYRYDGVNWNEAKLIAPEGAQSDWFGWGVSVSGDFALIGAQLNDDNAANNSGSAYVYQYDANADAWNYRAKLLASDAGTNDNFGQAVVIEGDRAIVGAYHDSDFGTNAGSTYTFRYIGDCNANGELDLCEIESGAATDADDNGIIDECEVDPCPADLTGDGSVGADDLANLLGAWGDNPGHPADFDGSGTVGAEDLAVLLGAWGACA